jgi:hypothetical protein
MMALGCFFQTSEAIEPSDLAAAFLGAFVETSKRASGPA